MFLNVFRHYVNIITRVSVWFQHLQSLERDLMQEDVNLPVYFAHETEELQRLYEELVHGSAGDQASTAWEG